MSPLPGPRPMPIQPRPATAYSDFQPYSSPPCPAASRTNTTTTATANMLTVKNQSCPQAIKAARPPTTLSVSVSGSGYPIAAQLPPAPSSPTACLHNKLGPSSSVPAQSLSTGKQAIGNNSVPLATIASEPQPDPKNNNVLLIQTSS